MNNTTIQHWLQFAPQPTSLAAGKRFHVFISYRSVNRLWVLQLYDLLRNFGYEIFLDQYVLAAAAPLALSLNEALRDNQAAVMIWSSAFEDSEWCKKEYTTLESMENANAGFRYVIAKLDEAPLPPMAAAKIHVDFSQDQDGPSGSGLLRLLYGLQGKPLLPAAITLAAQVDEELRAARAQIKAARTNGDVQRLQDFSQSTGLAWASSAALGCEVADALIGLKRNDLALQVLDRLEKSFPRALRPKQLRGLAFARMKNVSAAQDILGSLYAAGAIDPETLGIYARTWMDRFRSTGQRLYLLKSRDLYRQAFEAAPKDYYTGINAASKSVLLGERETAAQLAERVEKLVGIHPAPGDYWKTATVAEVQLLQQRYEVAGNLFLQAVLQAPEDHGSHQSTRDQAISLLDALQAPPPARQAVLAAFDHPGCSG